MTSAQVELDMAALSFEAPFLIEKLLKDRLVETSEQGDALFREVKRFIYLVRSDTTTVWDMYSLRIDEVWHQFILFTREYIDYCDRFYGVYVQHSPSNAPATAVTDRAPRSPSTFEGFKRKYEELYHDLLPDIWYDEKNVAIERRVLNDSAGALAVQTDDEGLALIKRGGEMLLVVNALAADALAFISKTGAFYVRELPGDLTGEEKVALVASLVECGVLRLAG